MNRAQRILAVIAALVTGVTATVAIEQAGSSQEEVETTVIEAAVALRDQGVSVDDIDDVIAGATGLDVAVVTPLVRRATYAEGRDPRAVRSVHLRFAVRLADTAAAAALWARAVCAPLDLPGLTLADGCRAAAGSVQLTGAPLCPIGQPEKDGERVAVVFMTGNGVVGDVATAVLVESYATPGQAERLRAELAGTVALEVATDDVLRLAALWPCGTDLPAITFDDDISGGGP